MQLWCKLNANGINHTGKNLAYKWFRDNNYLGLHENIKYSGLDDELLKIKVSLLIH